MASSHVLRWRLRPRPSVPRLVLSVGVALLLVAPLVQPSSAASESERLAQLAPDVGGQPWLAPRSDGRWAYGEIGAAEPAVLAANEAGLSIDEQRVASSIPTADGRSRLVVRDRATGVVQLSLDMPMWIGAAALVRDAIVVAGYQDRTASADGGIAIVSIPDGQIRTLVVARPFPAALGTPALRGDVLISPSGRYAASNLCGVDLCDTQVVDLVSGEVSRPLQGKPGFLRGLTETGIVVTDADGAWIKGIDRSGKERWSQRDVRLIDPLVVDDGILGVVGSDAKGFAAAVIDGRGAVRDLTARTSGVDSPWPHLWAPASSTSVAVIGKVDFWTALGDRSAGRAALIRVADGNVLDDDIAVMASE